MELVRNVERNSISLGIRKAFLNADVSSHTVLTDDVFSYVDFFFKTHKKVLKDSTGKPVEQNHSYYWQQSRNFYNASKILPIDSSPLPMYYCMLNAVKAYLFYIANGFDEIKNDFCSHGLKEGSNDGNCTTLNLDNIFVSRFSRGVFYKFAKTEHVDFDSKWSNGERGAISLKRLLYQLPFVHSSYISTYKTPRRNEKFIPLAPGLSPRYMYSKDNRIRLVVDLDRHYFKQNATTIPDDIKALIPSEFVINDSNSFQLLSQESYRKRDIQSSYNEFRKHFSYIAGDKRIWYLIKKAQGNELEAINSMVLELAIAHRFSEIVRYKPEQMIKLLNGKENWLIHEFLSLVLDQFMDEIACEITKREIMPTRKK